MPEEEEIAALLSRARDALDSYMFDPADPPYAEMLELCAKIDAVLRRSPPPASEQSRDENPVLPS